MTLDELGSLGEFLAAVATIATLIYLALQIRQNTHATRAASFHAITDSMNQVDISVAETPDLARIWLSGTARRSCLSEDERHRYDMILLSYFHVFETMHYQARVGAGERGLLVAEERSLEALLAAPGIREWWAANPYAFAPDFRAYIDRFLAASPGTQSQLAAQRSRRVEYAQADKRDRARLLGYRPQSCILGACPATRGSGC